jgi:hypothetical protein
MDKQQTAVIPVGIHPAAKLHAASDVIRRYLSAKHPLGKTHLKSPFYPKHKVQTCIFNKFVPRSVSKVF